MFKYFNIWVADFKLKKGEYDVPIVAKNSDVIAQTCI